MSLVSKGEFRSRVFGGGLTVRMKRHATKEAAVKFAENNLRRRGAPAGCVVQEWKGGQWVRVFEDFK